MIVAGLTMCHLLLGGVLLGAGAEHDPFAGAVEVRRFSFESEEDLDYDEFPDDWTRRKGENFPAYVGTAIDGTRGCDGGRSLRFDVNGGQAAQYSPPIHVDALHSYVFRGRIRTQLLEHDAAAFSVSFLNHKRQRIERRMGRPVTGTHAGWVETRIGPAAPPPATRFVVVGCHLLRGRESDIRGAVWFDDLWLGRLPQLAIESGFETHFVPRDRPIRIVTRASGLDPGHSFRLHVQMESDAGRTVAREVFDLEGGPPAVGATAGDDAAGAARRPIRAEWPLPAQEHGHYRVRAGLERDGIVILEQETSFAVMDFVDQNGRGGFGWSVEAQAGGMATRELAEIAAQSGINWLKYPLWPTVHAEDALSSVRTSELLELLAHRRIRAVGLLDAPPPAMREKFARDWTGISEVFTLSPEFWKASLDPVLARYSSNVQHWQLGGESDFSFVGLQRLPEALRTVKREFDRIGRDTRIGVPWDWNAPLPDAGRSPGAFFALSDRKQVSPDEFAERLRQGRAAGQPRWVVLRAVSSEDHSSAERSADLVRRMVAAQIGGAEAAFLADVFDEDRGLLRANGAPTPLFLPWRTAALALQGAEFLGALHMPQGSTNHVFARGGEAIVFVWAAQPGTERMYLGENVAVTDLWGRRQAAVFDPRTGSHVLPVGPVPHILRNCSEPIVRWQLAVRYENGRASSSTGDHQDAIVGINSFPQGVSGEVKLNVPGDWEAKPDRWSIQVAAGEEFRLPVYLTLPPNATLGVETSSIDFEIVADRPYKFRVHHPYQVGLGDVEIEVADRVLEDGRLEVEQTISNKIEPVEVLDLRCSLFVPGQKRQTLVVTKLGRGEDRKFFHVPDARALQGQELWLRAEQIGGNRVLNYKWRVGENRE
ncbi:MAG: hypothetical protein WD069_11715 [Planctomycetales bacterium]